MYYYIQDRSAASVEQVKDFCLLAEQANYVGVDTETTGLHFCDARVRTVQVATPEAAIVVDLDLFRALDGKVLWGTPALRPLVNLLQSNKSKVFQNAAFDLVMLRSEDLTVGGSIFDTMIASKIINNGTGASNGLDAIVERLLNIKLPKDNQKANWGGELTQDMLEYAARDAQVLCKLVPVLQPRLEHSRVTDSVSLWDVFKLEMRVIRPIAYMRYNGFPFNCSKAHELKVELEKASEEKLQDFLAHLDAAIKENHPNDSTKYLPRNPDGTFNTRTRATGRGAAKLPKGFNARSPQQIATALVDAGIVLPPKTPKGKVKAEPGYSTDKNLLAFLRPDYPIIDEYLNWKESATAISSIDTLIEHSRVNGRIHGNYNQMGADTGRLSANDPNLQQVKRDERFRNLFEAPEGYSFVCADFSQVELRVAAELSGEPRMIEAYLAGRDLHTETAALMLGITQEEVTKAQRTSAKIANFGLLYGAGPATLQRQAMAQYKVFFSMKEAHKIVNGFRSAYPVLYQWQQREGGGTSKAVYTRYGRRRILTGFNDKYTVRINTQVQGTAGDIAKIAIAMLWQRYLSKTESSEASLISMVHDELILLVRTPDAPEWGERLKTCMEQAGSVVCKKVPIVAEVGIGPTWGQAK